MLNVITMLWLCRKNVLFLVMQSELEEAARNVMMFVNFSNMKTEMKQKQQSVNRY
jgi:hypothetical protein